MHENNQKTNSYFQITKTSKLIDKSNELILNLTTGIKKLVENGAQKIRQSFSIKKVINEVRDSMRNELSNIYDDLVAEGQDIKIENKEDDKKIGEENSNEESESKSASGSKTNSPSSEGENSSPSKSYMEALKRTQNYMKTHRQKKKKENNNQNIHEEKSE